MSKITKISLVAFVFVLGVSAQRLEAAISSGYPKPVAEESTQPLAAAASGGSQNDTALEPLTDMAHLAFVQRAKKDVEMKENQATLITKRFQKHFAPLLTPEEAEECLEVCHITDNAEIIDLTSDYVNPSLSLATSQPKEGELLLAMAKKRGPYLYSFYAGVDGDSSQSLKIIFYEIKALSEAEQALYAEAAATYAAFMAQESSDAGVTLSAAGAGDGWYKLVDQALSDACEKRASPAMDVLSDNE
ncbi:MAG: hypothetical protein ACPG7U_04325 [Holosporaceae bacterium]